MMISFLMMCCNAKSNSLYQVSIQDKLHCAVFRDNYIYNYRSQHAGVSSWIRKLQVHQSCLLLHGAELAGAVFMVKQISLLDLANNCTDCSVIFIIGKAKCLYPVY